MLFDRFEVCSMLIDSIPHQGCGVCYSLKQDCSYQIEGLNVPTAF